MKKPILILAAVCVAACSFSACDLSEGGYESGSGSEAKSSLAYDALNDMLKVNYSQILLTVTDTFDENTFLKSEYGIVYSESGATVRYTVEQFAQIAADAPPSGAKITLSGEATIEGGEVVSVVGDDVGLSAGIADTGLTFKEEYFENVRLNGVSLQADVKDASGFLGTPVVCTDMKAEATFLEVFYNIRIAYTSEGKSQVEFEYVFTL